MENRKVNIKTSPFSPPSEGSTSLQTGGLCSVCSSFSPPLLPHHIFPLLQQGLTAGHSFFSDIHLLWCGGLHRLLCHRPPPAPPPLTLVLPLQFLTLFTPSTSLFLAFSCPFLNMFSQRHHQLGRQVELRPIAGPIGTSGQVHSCSSPSTDTKTWSPTPDTVVYLRLSLRSLA